MTQKSKVKIKYLVDTSNIKILLEKVKAKNLLN